MSGAVTPRSFAEAAAVLRGAAAQERPVRFTGGGTKLAWRSPGAADPLWLHTAELERAIVHAETQSATLSAGTSLAHVQTVLARTGVMLGVDPPLGSGVARKATVGGMIATNDSGPLSHAHGGVAEQILSLTVALPDGSVLRTDVPPAELVPGYDLKRLLTGSFGTLGLILAAEVRLHTLPRHAATALCAGDDAQHLHTVASVLAYEHPELQALDIAWRGGRGGLLARVATTADGEQMTGAAAVADTMREMGLDAVTVAADDAALWARQRAGQRSLQHAVLRIQGPPGMLARVAAVADSTEGTLVGRAALGTTYLTLPAGRVADARAQLPAGTHAVLLDAPQAARAALQTTAEELPAGTLQEMRRIMVAVDPAGVCNPGLLVGQG